MTNLLSAFDVRVRDCSFAEVPLGGIFKIGNGPLLQKIYSPNSRFNAMALNARSDVCGDFTGWHEMGWDAKVTVLE